MPSDERDTTAADHLADEALVERALDRRRLQAVHPHLAVCGECQQRLAEWETVLAFADHQDAASLPAAEPPPEWEDTLWASLEPHLEPLSPAPGRSRIWRTLFAVGAVAALVVMAVSVWSLSRVTGPGGDGAGQGGREVADTSQTAGEPNDRVLLVAVGQHLERTSRLLAEIANAQPGQLPVDRDAVEDVIDTGRLYRQAALQAKRAGIAATLDETERVLLEVAHAPEKIDRRQLEEFRQRIREDGLLFRVRVVQSRVRSEAGMPSGLPIDLPGSGVRMP